MVQYADENMFTNKEGIQFIFFGGQDVLMRYAQQMGYHKKYERWISDNAAAARPLCRYSGMVQRGSMYARRFSGVHHIPA